MRGRSPELWLPGGTPAPQTWRRTLEVCMWSGPAFQGCHSAPVKRALQQELLYPTSSLSLFNPGYFRGSKPRPSSAFYIRAQQTCSIKGLIVNILGFTDYAVSVATTQLCCDTKAANEPSHIPM